GPDRGGRQMLGRDIIVMGGSAGAYQALAQVASALPRGLAASVFLAVHTSEPDLAFLVREIANLSGPVPAHGAVDGEPILPGHIYVAPGGRNVLLERGRVRVRESPREHLLHPSINALFRSAAVAYGPRVVGVILSGLHNDGTAGVWEIKQRGGIAIVQSPDEARFPQMPRSALAEVAVDYCVTVAEMAPLIEKLVREPLPVSPAPGAAPTRVLIVEDEGIVALHLQRRL